MPMHGPERPAVAVRSPCCRPASSCLQGVEPGHTSAYVTSAAGGHSILSVGEMGRERAMDNFWPVLFGWAFGLFVLGVGLRLWDHAHGGSN